MVAESSAEVHAQRSEDARIGEEERPTKGDETMVNSSRAEQDNPAEVANGVNSSNENGESLVCALWVHDLALVDSV